MFIGALVKRAARVRQVSRADGACVEEENQAEREEMTEDEAKGKWCPMVAGNAMKAPGSTESTISTCIGSNCMMWRWNAEGPTKDAVRVDGNICVIYQAPAWGYCGLAGKP